MVPLYPYIFYLQLYDDNKVTGDKKNIVVYRLFSLDSAKGILSLLD